MNARHAARTGADLDGMAIEQVIVRRARDLTSGGQTVIVGVSGGVDSMVLLHALANADRRVIAAHVNYGLRGPDSDEDEQLVRSACDRLGVSCRVLRIDDTPESSIQAWARRVRYDWFERIAREASASAIAVAHHADDQAETVLINLIRGTGLDGLGGMRAARPVSRGSAVVLIRPMLEFSRCQIEQHARSSGLVWRHDVSNEHEKYLRSRIRSWVTGSSDLADSSRLVTIANRARHTARALESAVAAAGCQDFAGVREGHLDVSAEVFDMVPSTVAGWLVSRILAEMDGDIPRNRDVVAEVLGLLTSQPGRKVQLGDATVWRQRTGLRFESACREVAVDRLFRIGDSVRLPGGRLVSEPCEPPAPGTIALPPGEAIVDRKLLADQLRVRPWRAGDRLQPLGMEGTRKVKDILTDRRVPPSEKSDIHVVCSGNDIVWIVGADTNHRYRVTAETRAAARINFLVP